MARDRQRSKQRQAERRARRIEQQKGDGQRRAEAQPDVEQAEARADVPGVEPDPVVVPEPVAEPVEDVDVEEDEDVDPELAYDAEEAGALESVDESYAPRGRRGEAYELGGEATGKERGRFVQFLIHVWAELQRVQWPDRQALTTLTGVVLGFVLIAGGYLGLLDAIFSRLIQEIL